MTSKINRRTVLHGSLATAVGTLAMPGLISAQSSSQHAITTFRNSARSMLWAPEDYCRELGFFKKYGVDVNSMVSNRGVNITGVLGGDVDISFGDASEPMNARAQGQKVKMFSVMESRWPLHVVVRKDVMTKAGITEQSTVADKAKLLKGLRLGQSGSAAGPDLMLRYLATLGGLNPQTDMQLVSIQGVGAGMIAAVERGQIDGFCFGSPSTDIAASRSCDYLFHNATNPPEQLRSCLAVVTATTEANLSAKRPAILAWTRAMISSYRAIQEDGPAFKKWLHTYMDTVEPALIDSMFEKSLPIYPKVPEITPDLFSAHTHFMTVANGTLGAKPLPDSVNFDSVVDKTIMAEARASL